VDHKNHNGLDNRRNNLRICNDSENNRNGRKPRNGNTSQYKGVVLYERYNKTKWRVQITVNNKVLHVGHYLTELEAALAYNEADIKYHGEFACLNNFENVNEKELKIAIKNFNIEKNRILELRKLKN
jgi:hypothetical protein